MRIKEESESARLMLETGRLYPLFLTNANNGPLSDIIKMSNLCGEIFLPVSPLAHLNDKDGQISLCILSNANAGKIKSLDQLPNLAYEIVKGLDNVIDIQEYPLASARNTTENARYLGIGVSDWAHYLVKNKVRYDTQEALDLAEEFMEHWQFNLLTASCELAKERGEAPWFREKSKYANGWLPNDGKWRFISHENWEELRANIIKYGLRHLTLSAIPPAATSSDYSNSTSGIDMPRAFLTTKMAKAGPVKQLVPSFARGSSYYTLADELDMTNYLMMISKFQLYTDQGISTNLYWSKKDFEFDKNGNETFPIRKLTRAVIFAHKTGMKSLYYSNFLDDDTGEADEACDGGGCSV
jgi:ribonucleoside-diphosphate reductase alpha chain